jgi:hypothetical protein
MAWASYLTNSCEDLDQIEHGDGVRPTSGESYGAGGPERDMEETQRSSRGREGA